MSFLASMNGSGSESGRWISGPKRPKRFGSRLFEVLEDAPQLSWQSSKVTNLDLHVHFDRCVLQKSRMSALPKHELTMNYLHVEPRPTLNDSSHNRFKIYHGGLGYRSRNTDKSQHRSTDIEPRMSRMATDHASLLAAGGNTSLVFSWQRSLSVLQATIMQQNIFRRCTLRHRPTNRLLITTYP